MEGVFYIAGNFRMVQIFAYFACEKKKKKKKKKRNLCECVDTYVRKYTWPKLRGVAMCVCVRACENKKCEI